MLEGYKSNNHVVVSGKHHGVPNSDAVFCLVRWRNGVGNGESRWLCAIEPKSSRSKSDHVNRWVEIDPQLGIHPLVKNIKGSSHALRPEFQTLQSRLPTLWSNRDFVSTVGGVPLAVIKPYGENQKNV